MLQLLLAETKMSKHNSCVFKPTSSEMPAVLDASYSYACLVCALETLVSSAKVVQISRCSSVSRFVGHAPKKPRIQWRYIMDSTGWMW